MSNDHSTGNHVTIPTRYGKLRIPLWVILGVFLGGGGTAGVAKWIGIAPSAATVPVPVTAQGVPVVLAVEANLNHHINNQQGLHENEAQKTARITNIVELSIAPLHTDIRAIRSAQERDRAMTQRQLDRIEAGIRSSN